MIPGLAAAVAMRGPDNGSSLREVINALGLTSGLKLLLDAGDRESVASSSQTKWLDVSGNGYDFNRGSGSGSDGADPTFNGTIGRQSSGEYYSSDGADFFTYDTSNETWMQNLHKNSAAWTLACWAQLPSGGIEDWLLTTSAGPSDIGIFLLAKNASPDFVQMTVTNGGGTAAFTVTVEPGTIYGGGWLFIAAAVDEANNVCRWNIGGSASSGSCTYASPSSSSATRRFRIGSPDISFPPPPALSNGTRVASIAIWEGVALGATQLTSLFNSTRGKFGV